MPDISALYPQPPRPGQSALSMDPLQMLGAMGMMQQIQRMSLDINAQKAVGGAMLSGVRPDGSFDLGAAASNLQNNPNAAYAGDRAASTLLDLRNKTIANDTGAFSLAASRNGAMQNVIGAMANDGNLTRDKVRSYLIGASAGTNIPSSQINSILATMPNSDDPGALHTWAANVGNIAMGAGAAASRVTGPPGAGGTPTSVTAGQANIMGGPQPTGGVGVPVGQPVGTPEAQAQNQAEYVTDQKHAAAIMANVRPLQQALPLVSQLSHWNFGPGSKDIAQVKGLLGTLGLVNVDPNDENVVRQAVNKYLHAYVGQARTADRSDAALAQAVLSNPDVDLTQPANLKLIKNQIAMDRMDAAMPSAFSAAHPGDLARQHYLDYKSQYYQQLDPRAFQLDLMTPSERADVQKSLGDPKPDKNGMPTNPAVLKFWRSYQLAKTTGSIAPQGGQ